MDTTQDLVVVVGINRREGVSVARAFLKMENVKIRGLTKSCKPVIVREWADLDVEIVQIDYDDEEMLSEAFNGATIIFSNTDYWEHLTDHSVDTLAWVAGRNRAETAGDYETRQGINIIRAAAGVQTLRHFILTSLPGAKRESNGTMTGVYHFDAKWGVEERLSQHFRELSDKTYIVQPGLLMEDWWKYMHRRGDGTFTIGTHLPGHIRVPWLDSHFQGALVLGIYLYVPPVQGLTIHADTKSFFEICEMIKNISGIHVSYSQWNALELEVLFPHAGQLLADQWMYIARHGYYTQDAVDRDELAQAYDIEIPVTSLAEFLKEDIPKHLNIGNVVTVAESGVLSDNPHTGDKLDDAIAISETWWEDFVNEHGG
ncbi:NAD(P)-binding protein [Melanomma pulvis-pyrius CBS 109.77]|uniref:NAD(P)-binding protein n=1 Tax=Melanomma pulvis-pyrius CBS 109.77 TaxID=1314802 RepID=A0A6A6XXF6_9PLEO|nr:NAD(P)-binding protein [Melanomma pulvis-pyrius CBS 109.77]